MRRISAIFVALCMVPIAGSIGAVLFLAFKADARTSVLVALAALIGLALINLASTRLKGPGDADERIGDVSPASADLDRKVSDLSHRLDAIESRVDGALSKTRGAIDPIAAEIGELGGLVRQIAETVANHAAALQGQGALPAPAEPPAAAAADASASALTLNESDAVGGRPFRNLSRETIVDKIAKAVDANRVDLYLQPVVTLPQRKVRYYEALSRLRTESGDIVPAADFIAYAETADLMPKIDNMLMFRCVQVMRRLQLKSRDVGLFCNVSASTLSDPEQFRHFLDFMDANRVLAPALTFEFTQRAWRAFGPLENESLASLAERGFRFSMDHVTDLRMEPKELAANFVRYLKMPAKLLLDPAAASHGDIHPADLADLLARSGIDLIAERIESENTVVDLLDFDVRFGQGFLFSAPRPVRADALQSAGVEPDGAKAPRAAANELAAAGAVSG